MEDLAHVSVSFPKRSNTSKNSKTQSITDFNAYFNAIEQPEVSDEIAGIKNTHLISFQRQVNYYIEAKMKERDHMNSYKFSLLFIDYDNEQVSESGIVIEDLIRETDVRLDQRNPDLFFDNSESKMTEYTHQESAGITDTLFRYKHSKATLPLEKLVDEIIEYRNECEDCDKTSLKRVRNLIWEFKGPLGLSNEELINLVKIFDEDIFEKKEYPGLRFFFVFHAAMTYQYNINKPRVFVEKMYFYQNQEIMYQTIYVLLKNNVLPSPVFDISFIKELVATRLTYPSVKNIEDDWDFLKRLHVIKKREGLLKYFKHLFTEVNGDRLADEVEKNNAFYKLGIAMYKYISQMINSEDSVFINLFENIVEKKPINSNIVSKLNRKLNVNTQKNSMFDPRDFYKLVKNYLDKIHRKMNKYGIEPYDYIVNFTNDIFEIINDTLPSKTKDQKPSKSVNNKENRMGKIMNLNQFEYQGAIDCLKKFENIAEKLVNIYFEFVNREFKALFTSQYEIYEKIINPDICSSIINTIDSARFKHSIHFIVKLFYDVLKSQKEKQPSYVIYDAFKERLVKNFGDIKDQTHFVNMYFYYCQQLFAHIGIISVSSQRPFYLEVMRN